MIRFILFSLLFLPSLVNAQGLESASALFEKLLNSEHAIRQKEGTNQAMLEYFKDYAKENDYLYVIQFIPQYSPRLESDIQPFIDHIKSFDKEALIVIDAIYPDSVLALEYMNKHFKNASFMVDTDASYRKIFNYRHHKIGVTHMMKIDLSKGMLMIGGPIEQMSKENVLQLYSTRSYFPLDHLEQGFQETELTSYFKPGLNYPSITLDDGQKISAIVQAPAWESGLFVCVDEMAEGAWVFHTDSPDSVHLIKPTLSQERSFVEVDLPIYEHLKEQHMAHVIPCVCNARNGAAYVSFSLPHLYMDENGIGYKNKSVALVQKEEADSAIMLVFDTSDPEYMYAHHVQITTTDNGLLLMPCFRGFPFTEDESEDALLPFAEEFYQQENPFMAAFDSNTGRLITKFGSLPSCHSLSRTGYFYNLGLSDEKDGYVAYSDGFSGKIFLTNSDHLNQVEAEFDVFVPEFSTLKSLSESATSFEYEYFLGFIKPYNRLIHSIKLSAEGIHCIVRTISGEDIEPSDADRYDYYLFGYDGVKKNQQTLYWMEGDSQITPNLGRDAAGIVFPFYYCKSSERNSVLRKIIQ